MLTQTFLQILYRRDPTHLYDLSVKIRGCKNTANGCTLDQLNKVYEPYLVRNLTAVSFSTEL